MSLGRLRLLFFLLLDVKPRSALVPQPVLSELSLSLSSLRLSNW